MVGLWCRRLACGILTMPGLCRRDACTTINLLGRIAGMPVACQNLDKINHAKFGLHIYCRDGLAGLGRLQQ